MSTEKTKKMLKAYAQSAPPSLFLSGMFQSPPENFHNSESVEIDIMRDDEDVAIAIDDLSTGYRYSADEVFTNKEFTPPIFKEAFAINAYDLLKRSVGRDPFADEEFQTKASFRAMRGFRKRQSMILRSMEWQASQVLTAGTCTLVDSDGNAKFAIDYKPKATHFPTATVGWDGVSPTIIEDLRSLCEVVRNDGLGDPRRSIWNDQAFEAAMNDSDFRERLNTRYVQLGDIGSFRDMGAGGIFRGVLQVGSYELEIWTYKGRFKHPQTGTKTLFVPKGKVIIMTPGARLDATFGAVPRFVPPDARVLRYLPSRISNRRNRTDMFVNAWLTPDGETLMGGVGSRPLMIPTAIDTFGCLDANLS